MLYRFRFCYLFGTLYAIAGITNRICVYFKHIDGSVTFQSVSCPWDDLLNIQKWEGRKDKIAICIQFKLF